MQLTIPRGDYKQISLSLNVTEDEELDLAENEDLIFTLKERYYSMDKVLQKSVFDGTIVKSVNEQGQISYVFDLLTEDTINLKYATYVGDLKLVRNIDTNPEPETLELVELTVTQEATNKTINYDDRYKENEGGEEDGE